MHSPLRGLAALGATAALALTGVLVAAPATAVGTLPATGDAMTLTPESGNNQVVPTFTTSDGCPSGTTHASIQLFGGQLPDAGQLLKAPARQAAGSSGLTLEADRRWQDVFEQAGRSAADPGGYRAELVCANEAGAKLRRFTADLRFTSATTYTTRPAETPTPAPSSPPPTVPPGQVRPITNACPSGTPQAPFTDSRPNTHEASIDCIVFWRITAGSTPTTYNPTGNVTRGQMARFIANVIRESGGQLDAGTRRFSDTAGNQFEGDINALAQAGVVGGRTDGSYGPNDLVRRDQMARFLKNAYEFRTKKTLASSRDYFGDDNGSIFEADINRVAEAGFTGGTGGSSYSPAANVRRDAMASFLARVLDKLAAEDGAVRRS